eukprot:c5465_g1_i1.p2 GENE.c5465_g1_i1~~c5465_g1_i1.p2  ORF type:complete len:105 (+),score=28.01 c5465_g1_i1:529-843(+)
MWVIEVFVYSPLKDLYRTGPSVSFMGAEIGFWENMPIEEICSHITTGSGESMDFWRRNREQCEELFERKQKGFLLVAGLSLYFLIMFNIASTLLRRVRGAVFGG